MRSKHGGAGLIAASLLSANFARLGAEIIDAERAGADWFHFDVTDGHFVANLTMGTLAVRAARTVTTLPLDVHLMIEQPERFIELFAEAGADRISVHYEATTHMNRTVQLIRDAGKKAGVALGPAIPLTALEWILEYLDHVLLLSVNPGFGGQRMIPNVLDRIAAVKEMINRSGRSILIQVDGGVNAANIAQFEQAGADVFAIGSTLFNSDDYGRVISQLRAQL